MRHDERATLRHLARAAGVADRYEAADVIHEPPDATLRAVLRALGHPCDDERSARRALRALRRRAWIEPVEAVAIHWRDLEPPPAVPCSAWADRAPRIELTLEDGSTRPLAPPVWGGTCTLPDGVRRRGSVRLPDDLPIGYHVLRVDDGDRAGDCTVIVAPPGCPDPGDDRRWGWMVQTYAVRSVDSWGQGEFRDLGALAAWSAELGADFVLTNPVHADAPALPQQPSPYSPTSRRFVHPGYLHVPDMPEFATLPDAARAEVAALADEFVPTDARIDRDRVWRAKRAAFARLFAHMSDERRRQVARYRARQGPSLERFAVFCALSETYGRPWTEWPDELQRPEASAVTQWAERHADDVALHAWLQLSCREQLDRAQARAREAGMSVGIIHDLAVGVDPGGADAWALPDELARGISVGAPPDAFNEQGQNWAQPPPLPDAVRRTGYRTLRELLGTSLAAGGGLRIDHILGLSRLFWIPEGTGAAEGTYVRYRADEQFAVLAVEAHRADALVVGEDLGTVDARVRRLMRRHGVAGSAVLYFERDADGRRPAVTYPRRAMASVTTHDLPTATGWWDGSSLRTRAELGLLERPFEEARAERAAEQRSMEALLRRHGCLRGDDDDVREKVLAMHRFLAATPSVLVAATLWDAIGDPRQPNVPGTVDAWPNWRLPLAMPTADGVRPAALADVRTAQAVRTMARALRR
jgi:4-alpha-glucanotransferase